MPSSSPPKQSAPRQSATRRTTDSALSLPSAGRAASLLWRLLRLRCPHCGEGHVLGRWGKVRDRCTGCNFRYQRSDENYFSGAMFFAFLIGAGSFIVVFLAVLAFTSPNVPWDALEYAPVVIGLGMLLFYPIARVVWLVVDVLVRPVTSAELE